METDLFGPPATKPLPLWMMVCGLVALALIANLVHGRSSRTPSVATRDARVSAPAAVTSVAAPLQEPLPLAAPAPPRLVVKCVQGGRVSYSDPSSCRGKATQLAFSGIPDIGTVPTSGYGRYLLDSADARAQSLSAIEVGGPAAIDPAAARGSAACAALAQDIVTLDAASRSVLTPYEQDRIRITRQRVRAQQNSLGC